MTTLSVLMRGAGRLVSRRLCSVDVDVSVEEMLSASWLDVPLDRLRGRSILIATDEQFATACALIACDGVAQRMVICPPGLSVEHMSAFAAAAKVDTILCDDGATRNPLPMIEAFAICARARSFTEAAAGLEAAVADDRQDEPATEWVLPTSGTSGVPKLVVHTLNTLVGAMQGSDLGIGSIWSTFYDIRRYGGLQIFLRAMIGGGSMVLSSSTEPTAAFLKRVGQYGVTHISGTPSHWRRALMAPSYIHIAPDYVRLSGEIADQSTLDRLHKIFPNAAISHAFASTEAGVAFDVADGLAGFPAHLIGRDSAVALRVEDGSLRIKSNRTAARYIGETAASIHDPDGFVDTGDMVELQQDRYVFVGRRSGIINVGGLKIHPEEIEAVISDHPHVRMCVVKARKSPITGAVVTADVVTEQASPEMSSKEALEGEIIELCRSRLARHKVPISVRVVEALEVEVSGKMRR